MRLELPFPPTANTMFPSNKTGRRFLSARGKAYRDEVYRRVLEAHGIFKPFTEPVSVLVELYPPDNRKRDIDNSFKALFDSLTYSSVWMDDDQVKELHARMLPKVKGGKCIIVITGMD